MAMCNSFVTNCQRVLVFCMMPIPIIDNTGLSIHVASWWYTYPSEKYERQLGLFIIPKDMEKKKSKPPTR